MSSEQSDAASGTPAGTPRFARLAARWSRLRAGAGRYRTLLTDPSRSRTQRAYTVAAGVAGLFGVLVVLLLLYTLLLLPFAPSADGLRQTRAARPTVVLSAEGEELTRFRRVNREWVGLDQIPPHVADALLATEDHRFYRHGGVDVRRVLSALFRTVTGDVQGGSTITQQLARNLYPERIGRSVSITRKIKETITALKLERAYEKDELLEAYLNTVPFLYNVYGIELAARTYFGKPAAQLDVAEGATLVGMLKGTSYYNPVRHPERAQRRRNVVLAQMVKHGRLSPEEYETLRERPVLLKFERQSQESSRAPHFTALVHAWLRPWADRRGIDLHADGLVVQTTLDLDLQRVAARVVDLQGDRLQAVADVDWGRSSAAPYAVNLASYARQRSRVAPFGQFWRARPDLAEAFLRETPAYRRGHSAGVAEKALLDSLRADDALMDSLRVAKTRVEVGFVAIEPGTGHVKAWVGSRNYQRTPYDHVLQARRQPGSTFKPFVYARAFEEGFSPDDTFWDRAVEIRMDDGAVWRPTNADRVSGEPMTLRDGLVYSKNTITAQLIHEVGADDVATLARRMGVNRSPLRAVPSLALGTSEVTLLEMASAYATLADGGIYRPPLWVTAIADSTGETLEAFSAEPERALDRDVALTVLDLMRGVVDEGTGRGIRTAFGIGEDVAGKTGTTQGGADGWFLLMHPELVMGSWVGFDDPRVTFRSAYWGQGAHNALYVVGEFARRILHGRYLAPGQSFPPPPYRASRERETLLARIGGWFEDLLGGSHDAERREDPREDRRREENRHHDDGHETERDDDVRDEAARRRAERLAEVEREIERRREAIAREIRKKEREIERELRKRQRELERELRRRRDN